MEVLSKECWEKGHEVYEDMIIYENCKERVFFCKDCRKIFICVEDGEQILVKETLPIETSNKEIASRLNWLE